MAGEYRLPNGQFTRSTTKYIAAWDAIYEPICERYNLKMVGFDPDFLFQDIESGASVSIPLWLAKRLASTVNVGQEGK